MRFLSVLSPYQESLMINSKRIEFAENDLKEEEIRNSCRLFLFALLLSRNIAVKAGKAAVDKSRHCYT